MKLPAGHDGVITSNGASRTGDHPAGPPIRSIRLGPGGIGRQSSAAAEAVSDALRRGAGDDLDRRRRTAP